MPEEIKTVAMYRDPEINPAPHTADVHPDEVENWKASGWQVGKLNTKSTAEKPVEPVKLVETAKVEKTVPASAWGAPPAA